MGSDSLLDCGKIFWYEISTQLCFFNQHLFVIENVRKSRHSFQWNGCRKGEYNGWIPQRIAIPLVRRWTFEVRATDLELFGSNAWKGMSSHHVLYLLFLTRVREGVQVWSSSPREKLEWSQDPGWTLSSCLHLYPQIVTEWTTGNIAHCLHKGHFRTNRCKCFPLLSSTPPSCLQISWLPLSALPVAFSLFYDKLLPPPSYPCVPFSHIHSILGDHSIDGGWGFRE